MGIGETKDANYRSKMAERRKSSKPIMEKRRRERINNSLNELKNLLLESRKKDTTCCSKLEKADILEMTVQYLKSIRSQQEKATTTTDPMALAHYRAGFNHSAMEISRFLIDNPDIEVKVRTRLLTYLSNSCHAAIGSQASMKQYYPSVHPTSIHHSPEIATAIPKDTPISTPILSDPSLSSVTPPAHLPYYLNSSQLLMPSLLTNGKLPAVLVPTTSLCAAQPHTQILPNQHFKLEPDPLNTSSRHGQEHSGTTTDASNNDRILTTSDYSNSRTSAQAPAPDDASVWRPWR